jgi:hypothetical protein
MSTTKADRNPAAVADMVALDRRVTLGKRQRLKSVESNDDSNG